MPSIKIYPPSHLPDRNVSETEFRIWKEELEVYLSQEDDFQHFLEGGAYTNWQSQESEAVNRITTLLGADSERQEEANHDPNLLSKRNRDLRTFLSIIGKCVSQGHYSSVIRHSTSFENITNNLRKDYDIQKKGIHFFNILELSYDDEKMTPISFYNQYRTIVCNNLGKTGDAIKYNNTALQSDEKMTPMLEDLVLLNAVGMMDQRLPGFLKTHYNHKMKEDDRLMDFKSDIMVNIPKFLEQLNSEQGSTLNVFRSNWKRKPGQNQRHGNSQNISPGKNMFCRLCQKCDMPRAVFTSHNLGDMKCTQLSYQDKMKLNASKMTAMKDTDVEATENEFNDDPALLHGYEDEESLNNESQVDSTFDKEKDNADIPFSDSKLGYMQPQPTQILTVFRTPQNENPVHVDLDSGASLNYTEEKEAIKRGFKIWPNGQMSKLGDGKTHIKACGELYETFFRNNKPLKWRSVVCKELTAPFIGGTPFLKDNGIEQDFVKDVIHLHNRRETVQPTNPLAILPTVPTFKQAVGVACVLCANTKEEAVKSSNKQHKKNASTSEKPIKEVKPCTFVQLKSIKALLPGQKVTEKVPHLDGAVVAIEPWERNKMQTWPEPHLATIKEGVLELVNNTSEIVKLGDDVKTFKVWATEDPSENTSYYEFSRYGNIKPEDGLAEIHIEEDIDEDAREIIQKAHSSHGEVFNKDLRGGYNGFYGKHECSLNWASSERPAATKVKVPSYDHQMKGLQQEVMDELTRQGVLLIPQDHNITVQAVCPSFLQRKQRAKEKAKHLLTKDDVRLLINFGPINERIKPVPTHVTKTDDILIMLGRWKHLIVFDLFNGYFQNHMKKEAIPWLGIQTPFGGLRVLARSGQGLAGMAEEFGELTAKILKEELQEGICAIIVDDLYIGGETQVETATNYTRILAKMKNANLKIAPEKAFIFPKSVDVLGWVWTRGGFLKPSSHRTSSLLNTTTEDIKKVRDMRSWVGLYKTLHIVTPKISEVLAPFETATAGKDTKESFEWTHELEQRFREAKNAISSMKTLYLPSPKDQLMLVPDASKGGRNGEGHPGIGHILYAVKDGTKLPVRVHSAKLKDSSKRWSPCELEALACAAAIEKEFDIIRESTKPLIVCPDSKPVHEAVNLIKKGNFSTSSRMSSFLTNLNRIPLLSSHISGKAKLNPVADHQSRFPSECSSALCSICKFVDETIAAVLEPEAKNCSLLTSQTDGFANKVAWRESQMQNQACQLARHFLTTGKPPPKAIGKFTGELWNDVRQYCREVSVAKDGLLIVKAKPEELSGNIERQRIVIPKTLAPALLYHQHNHCQEHPLKSQQKAKFTRQFYAIGLDKHLENLYKNCYKCSVIIKLPKEAIKNETKTEATKPHIHFHVDVIKRATQNILTIKDHFSSYQDAVLIKSEKTEDLKEGIILLTSGIRNPNLIFISADNSPGFQRLIKNQDKDLLGLKIQFVKTDELNKNANAVIDRGCQEIEEEIKRLSPEGQKITQATLKLAVLNLNSKLRRKGNISAYEISSSRDQNTGEKLNLEDQKLRDNQIKTRSTKQNLAGKVEPVHVGDTVVLKNRTDKHKAMEMYLAVAKDGEKVKVQKILHPLQKTPIKMMSKIYQTDEKRLRMIHRPEFHDEEDVQYDVEEEQIMEKPNEVTWSPIDQNFFKQEDSDEEGDVIDLNENNLVKENYEIQNNLHGEIDVEETGEELEWDSSPEQLQLKIESSDEEFEKILRPRKLFQDEINSGSLTSDTWDDEVFNSKEISSASAATTKLRRQNAFRRKKTNRKGSESLPRPPTGSNINKEHETERRVTRSSLQSVSLPSTPSQVVLDRPQRLEEVLPQRNPLVPEAVQLGPQVQHLNRALVEINTVGNNGRPRRSTRKDINYEKYNETGDRS